MILSIKIYHLNLFKLKSTNMMKSKILRISKIQFLYVCLIIIFSCNPSYEWFEKGYQAKEDSLKIKYYTKVIDLDPKCIAALNNRGYAFIQLEKYDKAIKDFNMILELDSNYWRAYYNRGYAFIQLEKYELAIIEYKKVIALEPENIYAYHNLGDIYAEMELINDAVKEHKRAIEINPDNYYSYIRLARSYLDMNLYEQSVKSFEKAIELDSSISNIFGGLGWTYYLKGDFYKCIE